MAIDQWANRQAFYPDDWALCIADWTAQRWTHQVPGGLGNIELARSSFNFTGRGGIWLIISGTSLILQPKNKASCHYLMQSQISLKGTNYLSINYIYYSTMTNLKCLIIPNDSVECEHGVTRKKWKMSPRTSKKIHLPKQKGIGTIRFHIPQLRGKNSKGETKLGHNLSLVYM
jgi:hypothetical protein